MIRRICQAASTSCLFSLAAFAVAPGLAKAQSEIGVAPAGDETRVKAETAAAGVKRSPSRDGTLSALHTNQLPGFRVLTSIYRDKETEPTSRHLVLFHEGLVYDLPRDDSRCVTVYDEARKRVVLLDRKTKVRSSISTDSLLEITARAKVAVTDEKDRERLGLLAQPVHDDKTDRIRLAYGNVTYNTTTQTPRTPPIAAAYNQFADWAARLNIARRLGPPPFGRMVLNSELANAGELPAEMSLTFDRTIKSDRYRVTHQLVERLSQTDLRTIDEVGGMIALFKDVPFEEFPN